MIEITSEGINLLEKVTNAQTGEPIQYLELTSKNPVDQAFLNHIEQAVNKYNKDMYETDIQKTILKSAIKDQKESILTIPLSVTIKKQLREKGYLRTYEEFRDGGYMD